MIVEYHHIIPRGKILRHEADEICCLCRNCHGEFHAGLITETQIRDWYAKVSAAAAGEYPPIGPLRGLSETATLSFAGLNYPASLQNILRYHDEDILSVRAAGVNGIPTLSARFTDDAGNESIRIEDNAVIGNTEQWDITFESKTITVRKKRRHILLKLLVEVPDRVVIKRLDMRIGDGQTGDAHVLITDKVYAVGRYASGDTVEWMAGELAMEHPAPGCVAIEFVAPAKVAARIAELRSLPPDVTVDESVVIIGGGLGIPSQRLGIFIGGGNCAISLRYAVGPGPRKIGEMRRFIVSATFDELCAFIAHRDPATLAKHERGLKALIEEHPLTYPEFLDVKLLSIWADRRNLTIPHGKLENNCSLQSSAKKNDGDPSKVEVITDLVLNGTATGTPEKTIEIRATFVSAFFASGFQDIEQDGLEEFAWEVSLREIWPYWRELVHSTSLRMGITPINLSPFAVEKFRQLRLQRQRSSKAESTDD